MTRIQLCLALLVCGGLSAAAAGAGQSLPHIVFIFADDIGWADAGRYHEQYAGGTAPVPTPNINRLCDQGMMFTDAQLPASLCAPNRFCVMTGNYTHRSRPAGTWNRTASSGFHFGNAVDDRIGNPHRTVGAVLQEAGYRTAYFGKMHFGGDFYDSNTNLLRDLGNTQLGQIDYGQRFRNGMLDHGFDYTFVNPDGIQGPVYAWFENDRYRPISSFESEVDGVTPGAPSVLRAFTEGETVGAGEIVQDGYGDSRFDTSDHGSILSHFAVKFMRDHLTNHPGTPFMIYYASPAIHVPLTPSTDGLVASGATGLGARSDFVYDLDLQVGQLLNALEELGIADNTLVIFTSDNGAYEAGSPPGQDPNGPLRGTKGSIYEGGHRVPLVWKWGDGTVNGSVIRPGTVCNQLVSVIDWVPSLVDLVGGSVAGDQHQDSVSLLPLLFSQQPDARPPVRTRVYYYTATSGDQAARLDDAEGKWFYKRSTGGAPIELYDLATDLGETNNLVAGYNTIADLPVDHPHKARIEDMEAWYLAHNGTYEPRTEPALSYALITNTASAVSVNITSAASDAQQIDSDETFGIAAEGSVVGGWVNLNQTDTATDLAYNTGGASTVDLSLTHPNAWASGNPAYADTPLLGMIDDYTGTANPTSVTLSDLNASFTNGYKAIVYLTGFNANTGASITDGSTTFYYQTLNDPAVEFTGTLVQTTTTNDLGNGANPFAQYAVYGSDNERLTADGLTFTVNTLHGGGSGIGGVQLVGQGQAGSSAKTPIPVPVPPPVAAIRRNATTAEITLNGLQADVLYSLEAADGPGGTWQSAGPVSGVSTWNTNVTPSDAGRFYRSASTNRVERMTLPLTP